MSDIKALLQGFNGFCNYYMKDSSGRYQGLVGYGPHSRILVVACCDSRAEPAATAVLADMAKPRWMIRPAPVRAWPLWHRWRTCSSTQGCGSG